MRFNKNRLCLNPDPNSYKPNMKLTRKKLQEIETPPSSKDANHEIPAQSAKPDISLAGVARSGTVVFSSFVFQLFRI